MLNGRPWEISATVPDPVALHRRQHIDQIISYKGEFFHDNLFVSGHKF